jgi:hypothetical protein
LNKNQTSGMLQGGELNTCGGVSQVAAALSEGSSSNTASNVRAQEHVPELRVLVAM